MIDPKNNQINYQIDFTGKDLVITARGEKGNEDRGIKIEVLEYLGFNKRFKFEELKKHLDQRKVDYSLVTFDEE